MAPVGSYRPAQYLLRLLERVLKVLGGLTTPDWQVGQHRLQVRGSDGAQPGQVGASARWNRMISYDSTVRKHLPARAGHRRTLSPAVGAAQPASPGWSAHPAPSRRAPGGGEGTELVDRNPQEPSGPAWARKKPRTTREGTPTARKGPVDARARSRFPPPKPSRARPPALINLP